MNDIAVKSDGAFRLDGEDFGKLCELIAACFNEDELAYLLRVKMNKRLDVEVEPAPLRIMVFRLLEKFERQGIVVFFLQKAVAACPNRNDLHDAVEKCCPLALQPGLDVKTAAEKAATSVDALKDQLKNPDVRKVVIPHRDELTELMKDIDVLANYKRLHDYLQTINFTHYPQLADEIKRLRQDPVAATSLEEHVDQLNDIRSRAREAANALPDTAAVREEQLLWVNKLHDLIEELRQAVEALDDRRGAQAIRTINRLLRPQPSRLNTLLSLTAKKLPLEGLVQTIDEVVQTVATNEASSVEMREGLHSLQNMLPQLKGRVTEHEQWQEIENEFLTTDEFIEQGTPDSVDEFNELWPEAKARVAALAGMDPGSAWAKRSKSLAESIDNALAADVVSARTNFRTFRHTVLFHFFQVDRALRSQCEAILAIRTPLQSLLSQV
jgi:hypothetical protein